MKNQGWVLAIGIGGLVLLFLGKQRADTSMEATAIPVRERQVIKQELIAPPPSGSNASEIDKAREDYNKMIRTGITRVPGEVADGRLKFSVEPKPEAQWCRVGDFDLMKSLTDDAKAKLFLLSLEPLSKGKSRWKQSMSLIELANGKTLNFEIPVSHEPQLYGLYICSDSKKKGSCAKKQTLSPKQWKKAKRQALDSVLYFQLIAFRDGRAHIIPSSNWGRGHMKKLENSLGDWLGDGSELALKRMDYYISRLQPFPARLEGSVVQLPLPYNDERCLGSN